MSDESATLLLYSAVKHLSKSVDALTHALTFNKPFISNIIKCSACGEDHLDITFQVLDPVVVYNKKVCTHFAPCPTTGTLVYSSNIKKKEN